MKRTVVVSDSKEQGEAWASTYLINWCVEHPNDGLGGATGKSPVGVWRCVWETLKKKRNDARPSVINQKIMSVSYTHLTLPTTPYV